MEALSDHIALLLERGGYVMIPLLAISVISLAMCVERVWFWILVHRPRRTKLRLRVTEALRRGNREAVTTLIAGDHSPYGELVRSLMAHGSTDAVAIEAIEEQRPRLDRFMVSLSTIVTAAPLLGILGTVVGIIQSFQLLGTRLELTDPSEVAGGIAAALLTTALGLVVALMTLFPYMIFRSNVSRALGRMESIAAAAQQGEQMRRADVAVSRAGSEGGTSPMPREGQATEARVAASSARS